ncbi:11624_t:CDS:2 [Paraglomus brasilianum]|uniref:Structure-specific endonuclease subunit SLX4 n=1 Tax=Paraglomus brasilianum TaxID=144538 RepID=A0A9N9FGS2_9GLOM|nr:11624_t:CDS:2 [Paraglomus brasilianum]
MDAAQMQSELDRANKKLDRLEELRDGKKKETVSKISEKSVLEKKAIPIQNQKETVDNETKVNETKVNETKVNETKVNETKVNETKVNELPKSGTADNQKVKQMPDYKAMTKLELTKMLSKYGVKPGKREDMISMLTNIWYSLANSATQEYASATDDDDISSSSSDECVDGGDQSADFWNKLGFSEEPHENVDERLYKFFIENDELYNKILKYEPLNFQAIFSLLVVSKVKCNEKQLKDFLDGQGIIFILNRTNKTNPMRGMRGRGRGRRGAWRYI